MRIDPSQLSQPLSHILSGGAVDAAAASKSTASIREQAQAGQMERLDQLLLKRLRATALSDAASSVVSFEEASARLEQLKNQLVSDPDTARAAQDDLDAMRVRGLLGE